MNDSNGNDDDVFEDISGDKNQNQTKKSKVWEHFSFSRINSKAKCVFCEGIIKVSNYSTTAMHDHLLKKHSITVPKAGSSIKTPKPSFKIKCNFCDRTFKSDIILRHHLAFKHSEAQIK